MPRLSSMHRWGGLVLGLWFAIAGLSGTALVWWHDLADPVLPSTTAAPLPLGQLLKRANADLPPDSLIHRLLPAATPGGAVQLQAVVTGPDGTDQRLTLWVDAGSGAVLARQVWGEHWVHVLYQLHDGALLGRAGALAAGLAGLPLLAMLAAGLVLWQRRYALPWREALRPVAGLRGLRRWRNLHRALGFWSLLPLTLAALTGMTLSFPDTTRALLDPLLAAPPARWEKAGPLTLDAAVALAEARLPQHRVAWLDLPANGDNGVDMALLPRNGRVAAPARLHAALGSGLVEYSLAAPVEQARAWFMALHNGAALGLGHRLAISALGLAPGGLLLLGLAMGRRRDAQAAARKANLPRHSAPAQG